FLSATDPAVKVTRSQTKAALIGSQENSRSNTPISTKLLSAEDTCRGSPSPTPPPELPKKGRQRKSRTPSKRTNKRKAVKEEEGESLAESVVVTSASLVESQVSEAPSAFIRSYVVSFYAFSPFLAKSLQTDSTSPSDKPPIVLKLTLKKADKPAGRMKRSSSEKEKPPKERRKREKKSSLQPVITPSSPQTESEKPVTPSKDVKMEVPQAVPGRRRAADLLPGPISINEPLTAQVLNNMLRDLEIKYYGDEERHPYNQEQFNECILSGNFMRVRKAMVNSLLTAPRLATWSNQLGANLLHLLCRTVKCDEKHAGDDIATVLCNIAPTLLSQRDGNNRLPLHDAVDKGQVCRVSRLLTFHSPVNVIDRHGNTPLSLAYVKNHAKMVRILLQAGANFWPLESSERRKPENLRKRRAFDALTKHSRILSSQLVRARRKVYRLITEVRPTSPPFTAPFADGPEFYFNYHHNPVPPPNDGAQYGHILFLHVCSVKPEGGVLQVRCWGGLRLSQPPLHNNRPLEPTSYTERGDHMMFFISPVNGANSIHVKISDLEIPKKLILVLQVVLIRRAVRENSSHGHYPPLEQAPMNM
ncbi:ankyrin repeat protein, partial [Oesophagostomum dentatum]